MALYECAVIAEMIDEGKKGGEVSYVKITGGMCSNSKLRWVT